MWDEMIVFLNKMLRLLLIKIPALTVSYNNNCSFYLQRIETTSTTSMSNGNIGRGDIHIKRSGVYSSVICMYEYRHIFEFLIFLCLIYFSSLLISSQ